MTSDVLVGSLLGCAAIGLAVLVLVVDRAGVDVLPRLAAALVWGGATGAVWAGLLLFDVMGALPVSPELGVLAGSAAVALLGSRGLVRIVPGDGPGDGTAHGTVAGVGLGAVAAAAPLGVPVPVMIAAATAAGAAMGVGVGLAAVEPRHVRAWTLLVPTSLLAGAILWAGVTVPEAVFFRRVEIVAGTTVTLLLVAVGILAAGLALEGRIIEEELAEEAEHGVLPEWAAADAGSFVRRVRSPRWRRGEERRAVNRLVIRLAARKRRMRRLDEARGRVAGLEVGRMRDRLRRLFTPAEESDE